jgi:hypothetical protein
MRGFDMDVLHEYIQVYKAQLMNGAIQKAYHGIMEYILDLRTYLKNKYPDYGVSSNLYYGYMDMTYFALFPESLKNRQLKVAIVFIHEAFRFEVWLAGVNKQVQTKYWKIFKESGWSQYPIVPTPQGVDSILIYTLVEDPDFCDQATLTKQIEKGTQKFIGDVERFLSAQEG